MPQSGLVEPKDVFCESVLLQTVQSARIFEDSKTFVDMKMKYSPQETLGKFGAFMVKFHKTPSKQDIKQFVFDNFEQNNEELSEWNPEDWVEYPKFISKITNDVYREFALELHKIWKKLGRKIKEKVKDEIDHHSLIWVPNPVVVPGGRFREFYYWDSYWIIKGLLISGMLATAKGMVDNYLYIVNKYGYIPNGGRIYYLGRSQPPLLIPAFKMVFDANNDLNYLAQSIGTLEKEFDFWMKNRTKKFKFGDREITLATYGHSMAYPRPESYAEDINLIDSNTDDETIKKFYSNIRAGCESGWDFSSRWFVKNGTNKGTLQDIQTTSIVPVDLNAILYGNAVILSRFHHQLGNIDSSNYYKNLAADWLEAVNLVLWHEDVGIWLDYDLSNGIRRDYFYASNLVPLWTKCFDETSKDKIVESVLHYMETKDLFKYPGGIPQSLEQTGQQWDFPNAWPPSQHMIIFGLKNTNHKRAQEVSKELASKWLASNYEAFKNTKNMAEKFDATVFGKSGGGGEYKVQFGFGWSNAVILDILVNYFSE